MPYDISDLEKKGAKKMRSFGMTDVINVAQIPADIWNFASGSPLYAFPNNTGETMYISSSNTGDTMNIYVNGLDGSFLPQTETITISGQTKVTLNKKFSRINSLENMGSVNVAGKVFVYTNSTVIAGVPSSGAAIKALIDDGYNTSANGIFSVASGQTFYATSYHLSCDGKNNTSTVNSTIEFDVRQLPSGVFKTKEIAAVSNQSPAVVQLSVVYPITGPADIRPRIRSLQSNTVQFYCVVEGLIL